MTTDNPEITNNDIKVLMDYIGGLKKEIDSLKAVNNPVDKPVVNSNVAGNEIEKIKQDELAKAELKAQIEAEIKLKAEAEEFNNKYGNLISDKATLEAIDKANMSEMHKLKLKVQSLFKNEENKNILSPLAKSKVERLLSINETEIANTDITKDYFEIMGDFNHSNDLKAKTQAKFGNIPTPSNRPQLKTQEWAKNIVYVNR